MAKLTCSKSGTHFNCEFMPLDFSAPTLAHPLFAVPQHKLLSLAGKWAAGALNKQEEYLLFLALLDSTGHVEWRTHALYTEDTQQTISNNMESLILIIGKLNLLKHPNFSIPKFALTKDTATLDNVEHWIDVWESNYTDWMTSVVDSRKLDELRDKIKQREDALQRLIKSSTNPDTYAGTLADWAAYAGSFPTSETIHPVTGYKISLCEYWKQLIKSVANADRLWRYPRKDIVELIEHCEDNISHGNIYSHALFSYLRKGLASFDNYLGFGDVGLTFATKPAVERFTVLPQGATVQQLQVAAIVASAPTEEPKKDQFKSHFEWLKAYTKWKVASAKKGNS